MIDIEMDDKGGGALTQMKVPVPSRKAPRAPVRVPGMDASIVAMLFAEADADRSGEVDGTEARRYLSKSGLTDAVLAKVWQIAATRGNKGTMGLDPHGFSRALQLIRIAQMGRDIEADESHENLSNENEATIGGGLGNEKDLPPNMGIDVHDEPAIRALSEKTGVPLTSAMMLKSSVGSGRRVSDIGHTDFATTTATTTQSIRHDGHLCDISESESVTYSEDGTTEERQDTLAELKDAKSATCTIQDDVVPCLELRPSPMVSASSFASSTSSSPSPQLSGALGGFGSLESIGNFLIASPTSECGGLRIWYTHPSATAQRTRPATLTLVSPADRRDTTSACSDSKSGETDAAASFELPSSSSPIVVNEAATWRPITSVATCGDRAIFTGHEDGRVRLWRIILRRTGAIDDTTKTETDQEFMNDMEVSCTKCWSAHKTSVRSLAVARHGDLWSGSDSGSIRTWDVDAMLQADPVPSHDDDTSMICEEVRRKTDDDKGKGISAHALAVRDIQMSRSNNHVWTLGSSSVCIWATRSRTYIGQPSGSGSQNAGNANGSSGAGSSGFHSDGYEDNKLHVPGKVMLGRIGKKIISSTSSAVSSVSSAVMGGGAGGTGGGDDATDTSTFRVVGIAAANDGNMLVIHKDAKVELFMPNGSMLAEISMVHVGMNGLSRPRPRSASLGASVFSQSSSSLDESVTSATSFAIVGSRLWCFLSDGSVRVTHTSGGALRLVGGWMVCDDMYGIGGRKAAGFVTSAVRCGRMVFTLARNGAIRGWSARCLGTDPETCALRDSMLCGGGRLTTATGTTTGRRSRAGSLVPSGGSSGGANVCGGGGLKTAVRLIDFCDDAAAIRDRRVAIKVTTWNVNEQKPDPEILQELLETEKEAMDCPDIVTVCLQEVEVGTSSLVSAAARERLAGTSVKERGNSNARWWKSSLLNAITSSEEWFEVGSRQLSGIFIVVFARRALAGVIGEVETASIGTGTLGAGNKGSVAVQLSVFRRRLCFIGSHFAAHQNKVDERNADCLAALRSLKFKHDRVRSMSVSVDDSMMEHMQPRSRASSMMRLLDFGGDSSASTHQLLEQVAEETPHAQHDEQWNGQDIQAGTIATGDMDSDEEAAQAGGGSGHRSATGNSSMNNNNNCTLPSSSRPELDDVHRLEQEMPLLRNNDVIIWAGDFNYRLNTTYRHAVDEVALYNVRKNDILRRAENAESTSHLSHLDGLMESDQLTQQRIEQRTFPGFDEARITFPPSYKYDKHQPGFCFDSSEKQRVPSWTDRVLFRVRPGSCYMHDDESDIGDADDGITAKLIDFGDDDDDTSGTGTTAHTQNESDEEDEGMSDVESEREVELDEISVHSKSSQSHESARSLSRRVARIRVLRYTSRGRITVSDHKPVVALLDVSLRQMRIAHLRRQFCRALARSIRDENASPLRIDVSCDSVQLRSDILSTFDIVNVGTRTCSFRVVMRHEITGSVVPFLPRWLDISPASGTLTPQQRLGIVLNVDGLAHTKGDSTFMSQVDLTVEARDEFCATTCEPAQEVAVEVNIDHTIPRN